LYRSKDIAISEIVAENCYFPHSAQFYAPASGVFPWNSITALGLKTRLFLLPAYQADKMFDDIL